MAGALCAFVGFLAGAVGTHFENYYCMSGPSFPEGPLGWLRFLAYPGCVLAGRTGPHGYIDFVASYNWVAVAAWNALVWAVVLPPVLGASWRFCRFLVAAWTHPGRAEAALPGRPEGPSGQE